MPTGSRSASWFRRPIRAAVFAVGVMAGSVLGADAQTTVVLNVPGSQVTDTMIQGGINAKTNFNKLDAVATSANINYDELRHALLKFDTQNTMPGGSRITSATLTLTLKSAGADATRTVSVLPITNSFVQEEANWNLRRAGYAWTTAGGDFGSLATTKTVSNVAGSKVSINVTALVQAAVSGASSSRYTRLGLVDAGVSSAGSVRQYYSSKAVDPSVRPSAVAAPRVPIGWVATLSTMRCRNEGTTDLETEADCVRWSTQGNQDAGGSCRPHASRC